MAWTASNTAHAKLSKQSTFAILQWDGQGREGSLRLGKIRLDASTPRSKGGFKSWACWNCAANGCQRCEKNSKVDQKAHFQLFHTVHPGGNIKLVHRGLVAGWTACPSASAHPNFCKIGCMLLVWDCGLSIGRIHANDYCQCRQEGVPMAPVKKDLVSTFAGMLSSICTS